MEEKNCNICGVNVYDCVCKKKESMQKLEQAIINATQDYPELNQDDIGQVLESVKHVLGVNY